MGGFFHRLRTGRGLPGFFLVVAGVLFFLASAIRQLPAAQKRVMIIPINGVIDSALPFFVRRGIVKAERFGADIVVLDINTLGGRADSALLIRFPLMLT